MFKQDENKNWYFENEDGTKVISDWVQDEAGRWYYLDKDGTMVTGWFQTAMNEDHWFYAYKERQEYNGNTRYKGEMATGWIQDGIDWYYLYSEKTINYGIEYPVGAMAVDWVKLGDKQKWYYLLKEKTEYNSNTHYKGACVSDTTLNINGTDYSFDENGVWQSSQINASNLISSSQIEFTGGFEGMNYHAVEDYYYPGNQKYWTIGHGTCYCVIPEAFPDGLDSTCTDEQADGWLAQEMAVVANTIKNALGDTYNSIPQQIFDVMCDIGYNAGTADFIGGNTWNALIGGDTNSIKTWLMKWCNANDKSSTGLYKRCAGRVNIALYGDYSARP